MRTLAYLVLLALAAWLNRHDRRMLALTLVVAASVFIPSPTEWPTYYIFNGIAEILVALVALSLNTAASVPIVKVCVLLVLTHFMGYHVDGSNPFSPYRPALAMLETAELLCCILLSTPVSSRLRNRESP